MPSNALDRDLDLDDAALDKLDQALQLPLEAQRRNPRPAVEMAIASLESARDDLLGRKPS